MADPAPFKRDDLRRRGFTGFVPFKTLQLSQVPEAAGVYVLLREKDERPSFRVRSTGGHFKEKDPTVPCEVLEGRWVEGEHCVYIGKASHTGSTNLRRRLKAYRDYGSGAPVGHQGGRYVWQLEDSADLLVAWLRVPTSHDPRTVERKLIAEFTAHRGRQPFANIAG